MNPRVLLVGLSLAANVALGAWLALRPPAPPLTAPAAGRPVPVAAPARVDPLTRPITLETWPQLAHLSESDYVQRLKAEGFPPALIRGLLYNRLYDRNAGRLTALQPAKKDEYWRRPSPFYYYSPDAGMTPDARRERRQIYREISDTVKAAMGADFDQAAPYEKARRERSYGTLPADKIAQIDAVIADYRDMRSTVTEQARGVTLPEDRAQLRLLEQEQRADLAALLTSGQLVEYDLRNSPAAIRVRLQTLYFEPTEAEYRALTRQRLAFDEQFGGSHLSEEEQGRKRAAEAALLEQARQVLTPERYADYELVANDEFRNTVSALGRYNFDAMVARDVFRLSRDIIGRTAAIESRTGYTPEQRALDLAALYREASTALTTKLGAQAYTSFEQQSGAGNWLRKLKPRAAPVAGGTRP